MPRFETEGWSTHQFAIAIPPMHLAEFIQSLPNVISTGSEARLHELSRIFNVDHQFPPTGRRDYSFLWNPHCRPPMPANGEAGLHRLPMDSLSTETKMLETPYTSTFLGRYCSASAT